MPLAATGMGLEIVALNEVSQVEKGKCCMRLCMRTPKSGANNLSTKWRVRDRKQVYDYRREREREGYAWRLGLTYTHQYMGNGESTGTSRTHGAPRSALC